ncbi:MAG: large subunit ribosomal protein L24 [Candidatus Woesearchaeota archaeon]|jgi:large subunit ribosomal protein L24
MTKQVFSTHWKKSTQTRKQRKYVYNAPAHLKGTMLGASLSKELRQKHSVRSVRVRTGDKVKVMRGNYKGTLGRVESVDISTSKINIEKIEAVRKDGSKSYYPIHASNIQILELKADKRRFGKEPAKKSETKKSAPAKKVAKAEE